MIYHAYAYENHPTKLTKNRRTLTSHIKSPLKFDKKHTHGYN